MIFNCRAWLDALFGPWNARGSTA